jgi:hypothetical protein
MTGPLYSPMPDEKLVPTMIYTAQKVIWGLVVAKEMIRVCTWLQSEMGSNYLTLVDTQILMFGAGQEVKWLKFPIVHIETSQIIAYHTLPPTDESPYYDPTDPHRKLEPVTTLVGIFTFDCSVRMAENNDMQTFLGVKTGEFLPIYNAIMSCPLLPSLKPVRTPFALIRTEEATFSERFPDSDNIR